MTDRDEFIATMTDDYLESAIWTALDTDEEGECTELEGFSVFDFTDVARDTASAECAAFYDGNAADLLDMDPGQAGHDFNLTRNGHGAGFWDRGLGEAGERLSDSARAFGEINVVVGDDGHLHFE